ncbi:MAG TPA: tetratricopeptide repeat protein [Thermoanaerobaculia bacterium]|nr:tetratricopeptide repeat protein [Thermoanaerobaculia bacterium]
MNNISRTIRTSRTIRMIPMLALLLAAAGPLYAVGEGRILGTVLDAAGAPVADAQILLTRQGSSYKQEKKTDGKGTFTLLVLDATKDYQIHIEKAGFIPVDEPVKAKIQDTIRVSYTLQPAVAKPAAGPQALSGENQAITAYNEGVAKLQAKDKPGAIAKFEEAATLNPKLPDASAVLAELYLDAGKNTEAIAAAERYLALQPNAPRGLSVEYDAYQALGDPAKADAALEALIKADPGHDTAVRLLNKGVALFNAGKVEQAIPIFERALQVDSTLAKTHYMLGLSYGNTGNNEKGKEHLTKFLEMAPNDENAATAKEMLEYMNKQKKP